MEQEFFTLAELSKLTGCHPDALRKEVQAGKLKGYRIAGKYRIRKEDFKTYLKAVAITPTSLWQEYKARLAR